MSNIREIPGFYFDSDRKRYFKITNGAIPESSSSSSLSRYHNNSIQAEKRKKQSELSDSLKITKHSNTNRKSEDIIRNPFLSRLPRRLQSKYRPLPRSSTSKFNEFTFTPMGLLNLKLGSCSESNIDLLKTRISSRVPPEYQPMLTSRGYVLGKLGNNLIVSRIGAISQRLSSRHEYYSRSIVLQKCQDGTIAAEFNYDLYFLNSRSIRNLTCIEKYIGLGDIYEEFNVSHSNTEIFHQFRNAGEDNKEELIMCSLFTHFARGSSNCILRFNTLRSKLKSNINADDPKEPGPVLRDHTFDLLDFLNSNFKEIPPNIKRQLHAAFGLPLCFSTDRWHAIGVSKINKLINRENPSEKDKHLLDRFLLWQDISSLEGRQMIYTRIPYDNPKDSKILACEISKDKTNMVHFLISNGSLISFEFKNDKFSKFKHVHVTESGSPISYNNSQLCVYEETKLVKLGNKLYIVDEDSKVTELDVKLNYIRKVFLISNDDWILVLKNTIECFNSRNGEKETMSKYLNDNDVNQQFEIFDDHLFYNVGDTLHVLNIFTYESLVIDMKFQFRKCGYLKNFKLVKIVRFADCNKRLCLGFTFLNAQEMTTIFETYLI